MTSPLTYRAHKCFYNMQTFLFLFMQPTHLANFNQVQSIQYSPLEEKDRKGMLQLNVAGAPEVKAHTHTPRTILWLWKST